ncbi:hypothetical protein DYH09_19895 [bacterium CPR1]|nr:hypothetical protein [bacterium CPR1]
MRTVSENYFQSTYAVPVRHKETSLFAYADLDNSGDYNPEFDRQLATNSENSSRALVYRDLAALVASRSGPVSGAEVAGSTEEKPRFISFYKLPPGLTHPVVDFAFQATEDGGIEAHFTVQKRALLIPTPEGHLAIDHDADGRPDAKLHIEHWLEQGEKVPDFGAEVAEQLSLNGEAGPYADNGPGPGQARVFESPARLFGGGFLDVIERTIIRTPSTLEIAYKVVPYEKD